MRYAGATVALSIMSGLVAVAAAEVEKRDRCEAQLRAAAPKKSPKKGGSQPKGGPNAALQAEFTRLHDGVTAVEARIKVLFDHFVARQCREVMACVRRDVVQALGRWSKACPAAFMTTERLKYIAWGMSDQVRPRAPP